jgi:hypothetical protein
MATTHSDPRSNQPNGPSLLVEKARSGCLEELRQSRRFPFFQPVSIDPEQNGEFCLSAFSRDISAWGIGLLLRGPLSLKEVNLKIHFGESDEIPLSGTVRWCQPCGLGWYLAGISFKNANCDELGYMLGGFAE